MLSAFQFEIGMFGGWPIWQYFIFVGWRPLGLICLLAVLMMSLVGLLAIWVGLGRGSWFLRTAVVLGCISLLLTIPAFELVVVYVLQAGLTTVVLGGWRNWRQSRRTAAAANAPPAVGVTSAVGVTVALSPQRAAVQLPRQRDTAAAANEPPSGVGERSPWQFSILDMLLLMAIVAWLSAMLTRVPAAVWTTWRVLLAEGAITAALTIAAAWIGLSNAHWWLRLPLLLILFPAALMATWLCLWRRARRSPTPSLWQSCKTRLSQAVLIAASLAILVPVVGVGWRLAHPRTVPEPTMPSPNGYDELVRAAGLIKTVNSPVFETATQAQLKNFVTQCGPVYAPVRAALDKPCQVPLRLDIEDLSNSLDQVQSLRAIARALYGQGRLAAIEGRNKDAIASYIDTIRLGRATKQGGLFIDMLVGITFEGMGHAGIAKTRKSLSAEECLVLLPRLGDLLDHPALSAGVLAREAAFTDRAYGWQGCLVFAIDEFTSQVYSSRKTMAYVSDKHLAQSRLLILELAIRAYSLQHGRNPATLADLVPNFLSKVPKDPFDGGDFVYRLTPSGYELHTRQLGSQGQPISADNSG